MPLLYMYTICHRVHLCWEMVVLVFTHHLQLEYICMYVIEFDKSAFVLVPISLVGAG